MKKVILMMAVAVLTISCNSKKYTVTGTIEGLVGEVTISNPYTQETIATAVSSNGSFTLSGQVELAQLVYLVAPEIGLSSIIVLEPGKLNMSIDPELGFKLEGTPLNEALTKTSFMLNEMTGKPESTEQVMIDALVAAARENKDNILAVFWYMNVYAAMPASEAKALYEEFAPEIQQDPSLLEAMNYVDQAMITEVGQPCIPITLNDNSGKTITLGSIVSKNKYTLIDFWASWCSPCMDEVPYLISAYNDYKKKGFEIYGISLDNQVDQWTAAVKDNKMNWIQVSPLADSESQSTVVSDYAIMTIPTNLLIDQDGIIVAKNLRGEALKAKLAELMK